MTRRLSNLDSQQNILKGITPTGARPRTACTRPFAGVLRGGRSSVPKRIGLFGLFGAGNSGNDGSLEAMLDFLRRVRPEAEIICLCVGQRSQAMQIEQTLQVPTTSLGVPPPEHRLLRGSLAAPYKLASLLRAAWTVGKLDLMIIPGTGILDDLGDGPAGMPLTLLAACLGGRLGGVRIAFVSIGAGPIRHPVSRWLMKAAAKLAQYRSYRDTVSKTFMTTIGFDTHADSIYPDIAFNLPSLKAANRFAHDDRLLTVGVGVMNYRGWRKKEARGAAIYRDYLETMTTFVLWLLDQGHEVRVLMGDAADCVAANDLVARIEADRPDFDNHRLTFDPIASLHDLMRQIAQTDVVVATRFHNVVCALKLGKPVASIGYSKKNDALLSDMGLGSFCQHIEQLDVDLLIQHVDQLIGNRKRYEKNIRQTTLNYQLRLQRQESILSAQFLQDGADLTSIEPGKRDA